MGARGYVLHSVSSLTYKAQQDENHPLEMIRMSTVALCLETVALGPKILIVDPYPLLQSNNRP